jgi:hypothetical protein
MMNDVIFALASGAGRAAPAGGAGAAACLVMGARATGPARSRAGPARSAAHAFGWRSGRRPGAFGCRSGRRPGAQRRTRLKRPGAWQESAPPPSSPPARRNFQLYVSIYSCFVH